MKIVFSDLDGTLLDHHTYSYAKARQGLHILQEKDVPLVLVSSKTCAEMRELHVELRLKSPFVFENGGGIAYPHNRDYVVEIIGMSTEELKEKVDIIRDLLHCEIKMLSEMKIEEIVELTGLPEKQALLAQKRRASLPFIILDKKPIGIDEINSFNQELQLHKVWITRGGRFFHLSSINANKGMAVKKIVDFYREKRGIDQIIPITTIGIGDSENDIPLLMAVDLPFLVKKTTGTHIKTGIDNVRIIESEGPAGFTAAIIELFPGHSTV